MGIRGEQLNDSTITATQIADSTISTAKLADSVITAVGYGGAIRQYDGQDWGVLEVKSTSSYGFQRAGEVTGCAKTKAAAERGTTARPSPTCG